MIDKDGAKVQMLGISGSILHDMRYAEAFADTICALVSCTDEPSWAKECLLKFKTNPGSEPLINCVDSAQIYKANKRKHFQMLQKEYPDIPFGEMMFFDNELPNVTTVRKMGVHSICCPDGMTEQVWRQALEAYAER